jgi:hypothetical protein
VALNPVAVLIAIVIHQALGFLWYGPLFGKMWTGALGKTMGEMRSPGPSITIALVTGIIATLALAYLIGSLGVVTADSGAKWGALVAVGFIATATINSGTFENRPATVIGLYCAYELVAFVIMGAVLGTLK